MDNVKAPSGLSRDLLTLEEAFRSNLSLLKIKDVEIERYKFFLLVNIATLIFDEFQTFQSQIELLFIYTHPSTYLFA